MAKKTTVNMKDSVDKVIVRYFGSVTKQEFTYKGKTYRPKKLIVSPNVLRTFECFKGCGGCCKSYTIDFLEGEEHPYELKRRMIDFNGKEYPIYSQMNDGDGYYCCHLDPKTGWCKIHMKHALSCDFELLRFTISENPKIPTYLNHRHFGRRWAMLRVDGERGAMCKFGEPSDSQIPTFVRKMERLQSWCDYFELENRCSRIIEWIKDPIARKERLVLDPNIRKGFGLFG